MLVITHPDNAEKIEAAFKMNPAWIGEYHIVYDKHLEKSKQVGPRKFNYPQDRFVEYEPADIDWMLPLGMIQETTRFEPLLFLIDESFLSMDKFLYCPQFMKEPIE